MATYLIEIPDDSDEKAELDEIIAEQTTEITDQQYVQNIVLSWLADRVRGEYLQEAQRTSVKKLKQKFGSYRAIRFKNKTKG